MKAISVTQPFASLLMLGSERAGKSIETRSWDTKYRGELAIHASKNFPPECRALCAEPYFREALATLGIRHWSELPLGMVLGTKRLVRTYPFDGGRPPYPERAFGDFTRGRYGFVTTQPRMLARPEPARGALSLWDWMPAGELVYADASIVAAPAIPAEPSLFG